MKRSLPVTILLMLSLILITAGSVLAAPRAQEQRPVLAQPEQDAAVRGVVQLVGTAVHSQFLRYELYYAPWPLPSDQSWIFIGDVHNQQQPLGLLGAWDSRSVPDGAYVLRVRVVKQDGNYLDGDPRRVLVTNTRVPDTPTPAVTAAPTEIPTPLPPTATIVVAVPTVEIVTSAETPTPEPGAIPILPAAGTDGDTGGAALPAVGDLFDSARLLYVARTTAIYTTGLFVALGLFFGVKALLYWLWQKIRP
ncbi:MAG: hypothetical protein CVU38_11625 [Chloroflexi bacterium HGW-Chloroflexi-1]|nr:MAG: hypothetical protein CVU38_11625 [Chloroflexi bacterium HGW-Chloroflexi-1]